MGAMKQLDVIAQEAAAEAERAMLRSIREAFNDDEVSYSLTPMVVGRAMQHLDSRLHQEPDETQEGREVLPLSQPRLRKRKRWN